MSRPARLIVDPPQSGSWNMAVDQALLASVVAGGRPVLRFYRWSPATISLGYFQPYAQRHQHPASGRCPLVRRSTGGGAIVHDRELTYSLCMPLDKTALGQIREVLNRVHQAMIDRLNQWGVGPCHMMGAAEPESMRAPFLCFQRRANGDVLVGRHKIIGSAQRKVRGALLQHGSLLLGRSEFAPELPGLTELGDEPTNPWPQDVAKLASQLGADISQYLGLSVFGGELTENERHVARSIQQSRFNTEKWTKRR